VRGTFVEMLVIGWGEKSIDVSTKFTIDVDRFI
jgi:hypothetical protein